MKLDEITERLRSVVRFRRMSYRTEQSYLGAATIASPLEQIAGRIA